MRRSPIRSSIGKTRRVAGCSGSRCSGRGLAIRTTTAQENRISFAQPRGLTKGYFCPDGLFTQPTWTFESVAKISAASTRADGRGTLLAEPDLRRVETLEVHERPASIDPKGRSRVHTSHPLPGITGSSHERSVPSMALAARVAGVPQVTMMFTLSRTSSDARAENRSFRP